MSKELLTDDFYGYKYQQNDDGTISVRYSEIKHMLDEKTKKYDPPLIQLKAKKIIHDKKKLNVK